MKQRTFHALAPGWTRRRLAVEGVHSDTWIVPSHVASRTFQGLRQHVRSGAFQAASRRGPLVCIYWRGSRELDRAQRALAEVLDPLLADLLREPVFYKGGLCHIRFAGLPAWERLEWIGGKVAL